MIFIVACSSGSHLAVLQAVAWAGMFVDSVAEEGDVERALANTFDGAHPCGICEAISDVSGDDRDTKDEAPLPRGPELVWKLVPLEVDELIPPPAARLGLQCEVRLCDARVDLPAVPPPRAA